MCLQAHKVIATNPNILRHLQQRYQYLLVDEYQDSSPVQVCGTQLHSYWTDWGILSVVMDWLDWT